MKFGGKEHYKSFTFHKNSIYFSKSQIFLGVTNQILGE